MANSTEGMNWKAGITSYQLKWIAIVTMVIDHMGAILYPTEMAFRYIGRISFPIFCFLLIEGFFHKFAISSSIWQGWAHLRSYRRFLTIWLLLKSVGIHASERILYAFSGSAYDVCPGKRRRMASQKAVEVLLVMCGWRRCSIPTQDPGNPAGIHILQVTEPDGRNLDAGRPESDLNRSIQDMAFAMIPIALYNGSQGRKMKYFFYIFIRPIFLILFVISRYIG